MGRHAVLGPVAVNRPVQPKYLAVVLSASWTGVLTYTHFRSV